MNITQRKQGTVLIGVTSLAHPFPELLLRRSIVYIASMLLSSIRQSLPVSLPLIMFMFCLPNKSCA